MNNSTGQDIKREFLEEFEPSEPLYPADYEEYIGKERVQELIRLAEPLQGMGWANVNSTLIGGGVAEILRSAIPLARGLGIDARWYVIRGSDNFFRVTKKFHNLLQGLDQSITLEEIFGAYLETIDENAKNTFIASDLVIIHDPQPAALIMNGMIFGNLLWRCHIDTSAPNPVVWRFLLPYINHTGGAIFTMQEFVGPGLQVPIYEIAPSIDPRSKKNHQYTEKEALKELEPLLNASNIDPERPILAAISRYDIHKNQATIIRAFQTLRRESKFKVPPYLIFMGNTASDDPEGEQMLEELKKLAGDDPDIIFWVNEKNNDRVVGSLMKIARGFIHVSTREGFGLVVAEALWQGTPVIGSRVGGITKQVLDGHTGYLVEPNDSDAIAKQMERILNHPDEAKELGQYGRQHIRENFLLPEQLKRYLILLRHYSGIENSTPSFRLNELTYSELMTHFRFKSPNLIPKNGK